MNPLTKAQNTLKEKSFKESLIQCSNLLTPAFVYDESIILEKLNLLSELRNKSGCKILFSLKAFSVINILKFMIDKLDGFSVSSCFETRLARELLGEGSQIHFTSPGLRSDELKNIIDKCDYVSFNSLSQWDRLHKGAHNKVSCGLRINPQLSFVNDDRYDPCRKFSKLGVPINQILNIDHTFFKNVEGLLVHNNAESKNFVQLFETIMHIINRMPHLFKSLKWVNCGGGYRLGKDVNLEPLLETIFLLNRKYKQTVFLEPGQGIVCDAGFLVSRVVDIFRHDGQEIAILDTTVNHMPNVFAYQWRPSIFDYSKNGKWQYILAGSTCLAGDIFGEYCFNNPLKIGSLIIFEAMGAYTLVKAHMFNGINLPSIYSYTCDKKIVLEKTYKYEDFYMRYGHLC